jgi:uncharacterized membrane protein YeaQ/YmgE (transglycosylase-associated protein family)
MDDLGQPGLYLGDEHLACACCPDAVKEITPLLDYAGVIAPPIAGKHIPDFVGIYCRVSEFTAICHDRLTRPSGYPRFPKKPVSRRCTCAGCVIRTDGDVIDPISSGGSSASQTRLGLYKSVGVKAMEETVGTGLGILIGLIILGVFGAIVGWVASMLVKGTGLGLGKDILLGIAGSILGGWLFQLTGLTIGGGVVGGFIPPLVGAVVLLLIVKLLRKG